MELKTSDAGNLKSPPRHLIFKWILKVWEELTPELSSRSFKTCALNISVDRCEDDAIRCFKAGQPCKKSFSMLRDQLPSLNKPEVNPFANIEGPQDEEELLLFYL